MEFVKAFTNKKEIGQFKKDYSNGIIETEVIFNIFYSLEPNKKTQKLIDFEGFLSSPSGKIVSIANTIAHEALKTTFGKCDFIFEGNREYQNWIFKFNHTLFITPTKREVVLTNGKLTKELIDDCVDFEKYFINFCIEFGLNNKDKITAFHIDYLNKFQELGIIKNNKIDFSIFDSLKQKLKP